MSLDKMHKYVCLLRIVQHQYRVTAVFLFLQHNTVKYLRLSLPAGIRNILKMLYSTVTIIESVNVYNNWIWLDSQRY